MDCMTLNALDAPAPMIECANARWSARLPPVLWVGAVCCSLACAPHSLTASGSTNDEQYLHTVCTDTCAAGLTCSRWGQTIHETCELPCQAGKSEDCPNGFECVSLNIPGNAPSFCARPGPLPEEWMFILCGADRACRRSVAAGAM
jgi:hypothetical protein